MEAEKAALRDRMRRLRASMGAKERARLSAEAAGHLLQSPLWRRAGTVALYMAVRGEADPYALAEDAWNNGKTVLLPVCSGEAEGHMRLVPCPGPECLRPGAFGILEPDIPEPAGEMARAPLEREDAGSRGAEEAGGASFCPVFLPGSENALSAPDLVLVPGLAFTPRGLRLGMGGGYYDRLAADSVMRDAPRIGFAYAAQIVESLPAGPWDMPMHALCTEKGLLWIDREI